MISGRLSTELSKNGNQFNCIWSSATLLFFITVFYYFSFMHCQTGLRTVWILSDMDVTVIGALLVNMD